MSLYTCAISGQQLKEPVVSKKSGHVFERGLVEKHIEASGQCPITNQPDFAHLVIDYAPGDWLIESKSLKLFLGSFRNHGAFHEDCTVGIGRRLVRCLTPRWLRIGGYWYPRGGMPIDVFWQTGAAPAGLWLPDQGVAPYRGRG
jgi:7-cyano-7-deazaguanine reductase